MRIVGGRFRGRALAGPQGDGGTARLRPTTDRVREALFNVLTHGDYPPIEGARVLDLFAGTGALGLEALSRGAVRVQFVDDGPEARALLRTNIDALDVIGETKIYRRDATRLGRNTGRPYDYVFLDPPYRKGLGEIVIDAAIGGDWLGEDAVVILETAADEAPATHERLALADARRYGDSLISIYRWSEP